MFLRSLELPGNKMQTSHVACTLVVLFLSICCLHIRRSLAACEDGRPYVCSQDPTSHLPCCQEPLVLLNSVKFNVEPTGNEETPWNVTATVNWSPPTQTDIYQYSIDLFTSVIVADLVDGGKASCAYTARDKCSKVKSSTCPTQFFFDVVTNETSAVIGDLLFGHLYQVRIQAKRNGLIAAQHLCQLYTDQLLGNVTARLPITSPDCYNITGNATYCEQQATVPTASIPRDLNVQLDLSDSRYAFINITWKEPLFVNGEVAGYRIQFARNINEMNFFQDYEETVSKDERSLTVTNRIKLRSNYQVWIRARVLLPRSYDVGAMQDGNLAMLEFNTPPPISSSTTTFQTTRRITPTLKTTTTWPTEVYVVFNAFARLTPVVIMAIVILICRSSKRKTPRFKNRPLHLTRKKGNA